MAIVVMLASIVIMAVVAMLVVVVLVTVVAVAIAVLMQMSRIAVIVLLRVGRSSWGEWSCLGLRSVFHSRSVHSSCSGTNSKFILRRVRGRNLIGLVREIFPQMVQVVERLPKQSRNMRIVNRIDHLVSFTARAHQANRAQRAPAMA